MLSHDLWLCKSGSHPTGLHLYIYVDGTILLTKAGDAIETDDILPKNDTLNSPYNSPKHAPNSSF